MKHRNLMETVSKLITYPRMPVTAAVIHKTHAGLDISVDEVARWAGELSNMSIINDKIIGSCVRG